MIRMISFVSCYAALCYLSGCHSIPMTDEQIETISTSAGDVAGTVTPVLAPGAAAGVGTMLALGVVAGVRQLLKLLQKKPN
jgi:hypothetical protein